MEQEPKQPASLPDNAYRELAPGEKYSPVMPASSKPKEVTVYSVVFGIVMAIVFSAAAAYLGLRVGQVFEAAIPIAIIAVGVGNLTGRSGMLGQNVIIQSIGSSSGVIVAGAIFTLPALYILGLEAHFYQIFLSSLFGGLLGILLLIPFRKYFVKDMHGKYPFPEATATTEVLVSGEKKGDQAKLLACSGLIGGLYDFAVGTFGWWTENVSTRLAEWGTLLADKAKLVFKVNTGAAVLGLGYIVGLRYAAYICAGSFTVWFVLIPFISHFADGQTIAVGEGVTALLRDMSPEEIFRNYARHIGIGGIAMAGVVGIIRSSKIIRQALSLAVTELRGRQTPGQETGRTQRDLPMKLILALLIATLLTTFVFFRFGVLDNWFHSVIAILIVFVISFLFTTVAANAIAIVGTNPVSGMTLMTLILSSLVLVSAGLTGTGGMTAAMIIGGVHGALDGRRFHYGPEDRLLARNDAREAGGLEVSGYGRLGGYRGRGFDDTEPDVRIRRRGCARGASGQCDGRRHQAADGGRSHALDALSRRGRSGADPDDDRRPGAGFCAGHVHSARAEYSAADRRARQLVGRQPQPRRAHEPRAPRTGNADRFGFYRRRGADGRRERAAALFRSRLVRLVVERVEGCRMARRGNVRVADRLFRQGQPAGQRRIGPEPLRGPFRGPASLRRL